ncbi:MAG: DUF2157 domain-containing protein [Phenylobacterium sp.]|uniref:DUF2157 domain-containing protein n=1 Tax=Phenylobacterium sp. TaxID=1871053 RepID=UPI001A62AF2D|nr:DUF2157 domain-containing protein [Phenylobacterium sp.]MBL8771952.1 DUF2157 domain-containing protein [Phenylobacterium sp.]
MASYRRRLEQDLDGWIGRGLVPAESRNAILDSVGEGRRLDAATALGIVGGLLAGVAAIAFVAANWSDIPRIVRFGLILLLFLGVAGAGAWASARGRPVASQVLLAVAAMVFAAAIGLTGQIFDIAGDPQAALRFAAVAAALLALAGGSAWTGVLALVFLGLGEFVGAGLFSGREAPWPWWLGLGSAAGAGLAIRWRSQALAHAAGVATVVTAGLLYGKISEYEAGPVVALALGAVALAAGARRAREPFAPAAGVLYGWWSAAALSAVAAMFVDLSGAVGLEASDRGVVVSLLMLLVSGAVVALGRVDRHGGVTAVGVLGLIGAGATLLTSLGVSLLTSAAVFGLAALVALAAAFVLKRRAAA